MVINEYNVLLIIVNIYYKKMNIAEKNVHVIKHVYKNINFILIITQHILYNF